MRKARLFQKQVAWDIVTIPIKKDMSIWKKKSEQNSVHLQLLIIKPYLVNKIYSVLNIETIF